ncbi:MAG: LPS export ABC transporter ATP-binding protein [SAR86 cluster bacterium]|uniref:Lipopolysaccharide export system ATP-binding protein LptB n=1 Tax=SAR86 cluster bacterium TaxID=2030880 RepID=A0A937HVF5_9GAMM|nr:LPS export ABC transporter ATP-binding protein [SAR86 cluster bacterium]
MRIEGKKLKKVSNKINILESVDISITSEKIYGLLGPNGAGKTSLFSILAGLSKPSEGEVLYDSKIVNSLSFEQRSELGVIYLPQEPSVFRELTVEENIKAALESKKYDKKEIKNKLSQISEEFDLMSIKTQKCNSLSGGQRRRVEIARAIALSPKLILLDEPFAGIDPLIISEIKTLIEDLKEKDIGVLISDHNVNATLDICDFIYVINSGQVIAQGIPSEIVQNELVKKVYLGDMT